MLKNGYDIYSSRDKFVEFLLFRILIIVLLSHLRNYNKNCSFTMYFLFISTNNSLSESHSSFLIHFFLLSIQHSITKLIIYLSQPFFFSKGTLPKSICDLSKHIQLYDSHNSNRTTRPTQKLRQFSNSPSSSSSLCRSKNWLAYYLTLTVKATVLSVYLQPHIG